jgi:hypothetical protein
MQLYKKLFKHYMEDGEEIFYVVHHHIITIFKPITKILILYIGLSMFFWYLVPKLSFIWLVIWLIGFFKTVSILLAWYFNALLVTNLNLIDVEWNGLFNRAANRIEYSQVESFSYSVVGIFNTIFNFGDITIDKSSGNQVVIRGAYKPKLKSQLLTKIQDEMVNSQLKKDHEGLKGVLTSLLRKHIQDHGIVITDD